MKVEELQTYQEVVQSLRKKGRAKHLLLGNGFSMAIAETNIPYIISVTIQKDGKLIDGYSIDFVIRSIDNSVSRKPLRYMTICVHPTIIHETLSHPFNQTRSTRKPICWYFK